MNKTIFLTGILFGLTGILLGAFGAHGLEKLIAAKALQTYETGVKYQMYHALFLMILAGIKPMKPESKKLVFYLILFGILLFSFSIYLLALNELTDFDFRAIAFLTPLGGIMLILGWGILGYRSFKYFD
ncbi:MAG: DUF423 domain-containing protein [Maribacter sp.]|nr:DUF423 domain-containing protein [Maribacter sp.]